MMRAVKRAGIPVHRRAGAFSIEGEGRVERVRFVDEQGASRSIGTSLVLLHQGVIPSTQLSRALACEHEWDASSACWRPRTDARGAAA